MKYDNYLKTIDKIEKLEQSGMSPEDASNYWFNRATRFHHSRIVNSGFPCFKKDKFWILFQTFLVNDVLAFDVLPSENPYCKPIF